MLVPLNFENMFPISTMVFEITVKGIHDKALFFQSHILLLYIYENTTMSISNNICFRKTRYDIQIPCWDVTLFIILKLQYQLYLCNAIQHCHNISFICLVTTRMHADIIMRSKNKMPAPLPRKLYLNRVKRKRRERILAWASYPNTFVKFK